ATGCTLDELLARIYRHPRDRAILAGLAPVVARCGSGRDRDPVARDIEAAAAAELAGLARALLRRLDARPTDLAHAAVADDGTADDGTADDGTADDGTADDGTADDGTADGEPREAGLPVAGVGGVFSMPELWAEFSRRTGARRPVAPPEIGAALLTVS
ncbi:MAG: hypothetical protein ACYCPF_05270, partial [Streptosporangiaceae bacterium]